MPDRKLLIDLGNTRIKWAWAGNGVLDTDSAGHGDVGEFARACQVPGQAPPTAILLSSVASAERTQGIVEQCARLWDVPVQRLRSRTRQGGVRNGYAEPEKLGVDRWLAIVGAASAYGLPVVVWDLGTAATLDAVDAGGRHLGGLILPGPETMLAGLAQKTGLDVPQSMPRVRRRQPGRRTGDCVVQGVLAAQIGAARLFLEEIGDLTSAMPTLVVAGGAAAAVREVSGLGCIHDPWLVFRGMLTA